MAKQPKVVKVNIYGTEYSIKAEEPKEYYLKIADYVNEKMDEISKNLNIVSTSKVAILAALRITEELFLIKEKKHRKK
jgi:cell division protein ZapA